MLGSKTKGCFSNGQAFPLARDGSALRQIVIRLPSESSKEMQVRRGVNDTAAIARQKKVMVVERVDIDDMAGLWLKDE